MSVNLIVTLLLFWFVFPEIERRYIWPRRERHLLTPRDGFHYGQMYMSVLLLIIVLLGALGLA